jgi:hypothetical protein
MIGELNFYGRPEKRWEHELRKLSKASLLHFIDVMIFVDKYFHLFDETAMLKRVHQAKEAGRFDNLELRWDRADADPVAFYQSTLRRQRSAKAAARRRKAAVRSIAKERRMS